MHMSVCLYVCFFLCVYIYIYVCVCVCVCVYIGICMGIYKYIINEINVYKCLLYQNVTNIEPVGLAVF